jgi:hypothetical protein
MPLAESDRFADGDPAHVHLLREHGFGGQDVARCKFACANLLAHLVENLPV